MKELGVVKTVIWGVERKVRILQDENGQYYAEGIPVKVFDEKYKEIVVLDPLGYFITSVHLKSYGAQIIQYYYNSPMRFRISEEEALSLLSIQKIKKKAKQWVKIKKKEGGRYGN